MQKRACVWAAGVLTMAGCCSQESRRIQLSAETAEAITLNAVASDLPDRAVLWVVPHHSDELFVLLTSSGADTHAAVLREVLSGQPTVAHAWTPSPVKGALLATQFNRWRDTQDNLLEATASRSVVVFGWDEFYDEVYRLLASTDADVLRLGE